MAHRQVGDMKPEYLAEFRFYEELNDFLSPLQHKRTILYRFSGHPGIKDPIEAFGVPHPEVELIIVNAESVGFDYQLQADDRVAVYPVFKSLDTKPLLKLREKIAPKPPLRPGRESRKTRQTHAYVGFRLSLSQRL